MSQQLILPDEERFAAIAKEKKLIRKYALRTSIAFALYIGTAATAILLTKSNPALALKLFKWWMLAFFFSPCIWAAVEYARLSGAAWRKQLLENPMLPTPYCPNERCRQLMDRLYSYCPYCGTQLPFGSAPTKLLG